MRSLRAVLLVAAATLVLLVTGPLAERPPASLAPVAPRPLCSGFFFVGCSRQCAGGGQQSAFASGCTCGAAQTNCASKLTCGGATTFGPCDS